MLCTPRLWSLTFFLQFECVVVLFGSVSYRRYGRRGRERERNSLPPHSALVGCESIDRYLSVFAFLSFLTDLCIYEHKLYFLFSLHSQMSHQMEWMETKRIEERRRIEFVLHFISLVRCMWTSRRSSSAHPMGLWKVQTTTKHHENDIIYLLYS